MNRIELNRRDFARLTASAFGGIVAGSIAGCRKAPESETSGAGVEKDDRGDTPSPEGEAPAASQAEETEEVSLLLQEPHVCRGLNTCAGKGKGGDNACAGQGACATATAHSCSGMNECKGQGGCGGKQGENACKGMGGCHVPLEHGWEDVRARFEAAMKAAGKEFGPAPQGG